MVMFSPYRPDVAQRVGRGVALFFHLRGTRRDKTWYWIKYDSYIM